MADAGTDGCWVGFDLGGTKMLATVFDAEFQVIGRKRRKTKGHEGAQSGVKRIIEAIDLALEDADCPRGTVQSIGIGCPGPLDLSKGVIVDAPNLGWRDVAIQDKLEDEFGCPTVLMNDVDAGVFGEWRFGAGADHRCVVGVFPGTGIGGGCVYDGQILRGEKSSCLEIGHIQVMPEGPRCGCGRRGCLEAVASRLAISAAAAQSAYRGHAPHLLKLAGTDLANIRSGILAAAIEQGDSIIEQIVTDAAQHIGAAVAGVINLLAPDCIVLGGGLVEAMPQLFVKAVEKAARNRVLPESAVSFEVVAAELGDDACVMGAAAWAQESMAAHSHAK